MFIGFCVGVKFSFLEVNTQECNCHVICLVFYEIANFFSQRVCIILRSHQQYMWYSFFIPSLALDDVTIFYSIHSNRWVVSSHGGFNLHVFNCMSLMANDVAYLVMCLLAICISSSVKCFFMYFLLNLIFESSLCTPDTSSLSEM